MVLEAVDAWGGRRLEESLGGTCPLGQVCRGLKGAAALLRDMSA